MTRGASNRMSASPAKSSDTKPSEQALTREASIRFAVQVLKQVSCDGQGSAERDGGIDYQHSDWAGNFSRLQRNGLCRIGRGCSVGGCAQPSQASITSLGRRPAGLARVALLSTPFRKVAAKQSGKAVDLPPLQFGDGVSQEGNVFLHFMIIHGPISLLFGEILKPSGNVRGDPVPRMWSTESGSEFRRRRRR